MISVAEARARALDLVSPLPAEDIPLRDAAGRMLAAPVAAELNSPSFASSAMDGYAVRDTEVRAGAVFSVIGESAAGRGFPGEVSPGEAVRIFTGAPLPKGTDRVIIQEDVVVKEDKITLQPNHDTAQYVRPLGADFKAGQAFSLDTPLSSGHIALLAGMNQAIVRVRRKPVVALIATGDELVMPGNAPGSDQIIASNAFGIAAMVESHGAHARILPIAQDTKPSLHQAFDLADGADLIVTIGGASVGDYDLIAPVVAERGLKQAFHKIAMRPGKPLLAGTLGNSAMIGLPGNPVSSMICAMVFILPMVARMLGKSDPLPPVKTATLTQDLRPNGPREHYMRAVLSAEGIAPQNNQDSALLSIYVASNALLIRPAHDGARQAGELVEYIDLP